MSALGSGATLAGPRRTGASATGHLVLVRISAAGGATRAEVAADLAPLFTHKLSPADWRRLAEREIGHLLANGLAVEEKRRLAATGDGARAAAHYLGQKTVDPKPWAELRDIGLIAKGLGLEKETSARVKPLARVEGLRTLIVQKAFGLSVKKNAAPTKLRAQLAVVALERAFGNRIKAGIGKGSALSAKAGRLLAGQLSQNPRAFATDAKLIAELAAERAGAKDSTLAALRVGVLRGLGARALDAGSDIIPTPDAPPQMPLRVPAPDAAPPTAANDSAPVAVDPPKALRPDLPQFAFAVKKAAASRAEGWSGSRKAYISHVWEAIRASEPAWALSEIEFKCMLAEAHRAGALVLANADLKDKRNADNIERSAVPYKNTVWHFVRVEE
ncbi:hypothetical protein W911_00575 [Hyphomicrobium nitrativorans NL23]|uniref:Uncharacterized protein n=1 Tax=Hyphomicrobium nitrativorans NL23 TaxID=1029756 RepID=V5SB88_9HYPH|nr:hypothetical protein [Hyphomicrobium nitrativorans]AHB47229.1 hypothetical protein W911_00575 [Hyphomicrobium nitrativorans NL23]